MDLWVLGQSDLQVSPRKARATERNLISKTEQTNKTKGSEEWTRAVVRGRKRDFSCQLQNSALIQTHVKEQTPVVWEGSACLAGEEPTFEGSCLLNISLVLKQ